MHNWTVAAKGTGLSLTGRERAEREFNHSALGVHKLIGGATSPLLLMPLWPGSRQKSFNTTLLD